MIVKRIFHTCPPVVFLCSILVATGAARADVVYDFVQQGEAMGQYGPVPIDIGFQLTFHDDFVPEMLNRQCYMNGCGGAGDFATFSLSVTAPYGDEIMGPGYDRYGETDEGYLSYDSGFVTWNTATTDAITFSYGQGAWSATINNDYIAGECGQPGCVVNGNVTPVPEPASLRVLLAALAGIAACRRRRSAS